MLFHLLYMSCGCPCNMDLIIHYTIILSFTGYLWWVYGGICGEKVCCKVSPCFYCKWHLHCNQFHSGNDTKACTWFSFSHILYDLIKLRHWPKQVLEFQKGRLQNLYWKRDGCASCSGKSRFFCLNKQDCAIRTSSCKNRGGSVDCSLGIQLAFSGTDKHLTALNSWYEVENLRQYSLYGLYSNLKNSLTSQYNNFF